MVRSTIALGALSLSLCLAAPASAAISFNQDASNEYATGNDPYRLTSADFTGDGKADIATANGTSGNVSVFVKTAGFGFTQEAGSPVAAGTGPSGIVSGDWNADGKADLAVSNFGSSTVTSLIRQVGTGFAVEANDSASANQTSAIANAGDYTGDGRPDLIVTGRQTNIVRLMARRTTPTNGFDAVANTITTGIDPRAIATGNFITASTRADIVTTNSSDDTIRLFRSNDTTTGPGWWTAVTNKTTGDNPQEVVTADFNNDGKPDVAVSGYGNGAAGTATVQVFLGTGTDFNAEGSPIVVGQGNQGLAAGDFDLDGKIDLAVASHESDQVFVLRRNDAATGFDAPLALPTFDGPNGLIVGEFNGDSQPDIAVTSDNVDKLRVITNTTLGQPGNLTRPLLTGTPTPGSSLSCSSGTWTNNPTLTKTWERAPRATVADGDPAWTPINGATGPSYTVQAGDVGSRIHCRVDAVNAGGSTTGYSASLRPDVGPPALLRAPAVGGTRILGQTLNCDVGSWSNSPDFTFRWLRNGNVIPGEAGASYATSGADTDTRVTCDVAAANDLGSAGPVAATALHVVSAAPTNFLRPETSVDGSSNRPVGRVATCSPGGWTQDDGEYVYRWDRDGSEIPGATGKTYTTTSADLGVEIRCRVKSVNPVGESAFATAAAYRLRLPPGTESSSIDRSTPRNEFDPVNFLAMSADYRAAVSAVITLRLKAAVSKETEKCADRKDLPAKAPVLTSKDFPLSEAKRCAVLVRAPTLVDVGGFGVQYLMYAQGKARAAQEAPCSRPGKGTCPDMGFAVDPVDPNKPGSLSDAEFNILDGATPERILWDTDRDGLTDVDCPASAPVMRTLPDKGTYDVRAVIVTKDSSVTNVFGSAAMQYEHFSSARGKVRKTQPFVCRTSVDPPPDPTSAPCLTKGVIARVKVTGNFCPVYLRALDPSVINDLPPDVYDLLKAMSDKLPLHKRNDGKVHVAATDTSSIWRQASTSINLKVVASTYANTASSQVSLPQNNDKITSYKRFATTIGEALRAGTFVKGKFNFALDEIYWAKGPVTVNGVTEAPRQDKPTLLVPTDSKEALTTVKTMIINSPSVQVGLSCGKNPTSFDSCGMPLTEKIPLNAKIQEAKDEGVQFLTGAANPINLDELGAELRKKANKLTAPFKIVGDADIKLEKDGTATLTAIAAVPLLKNADGSDIKLKVTLNGDQDGNLKLTGIRLGPVGAKLGGVNLRDVIVEYGADGLAVSGQLLFPPVDAGIDLRDFRIDRDGKFAGMRVDYLAGAGQGIPIGAVPGTFLTKFGGGIPRVRNPFEVAVDAAVSVGPSAGGGCPTAGVDGTLDAQINKPNAPAFIATFHADVVIVCIRLATVDVYVDSSPYFSVDGNIDITLGPLRVQGGVGAAVAPGRAWQLTAYANLTLEDLPIVGDIGPIGGQFALSSVGLAACVRVIMPDPIPNFAGGFGIRFPGGIPPLNILSLISNLELFLGCDLSDYRPLGRRVYARGAQAGVNEFTLPKDATTGMLSIEGAGGAPRVRLTSPSGKVFDYSNATSRVTAPPTVGQLDEAHDRLIVFYGKAEAGKWTVTPVPGSPTISRLRLKTILPKPKVTGKLSGKGSSRTLSYDATSIAGQQVRFVEQGGGLSRTLKTIKTGGRGSFRFSPAEGRTSKRTIVAQIIQDDLPRASIKLASYTAANPKVGRPGRLKVTRKGSKATVTWRKATLGASYEVSVRNLTQGTSYPLFPLKGKTSVVITKLGAKDKLTVSVVAKSRGGRAGPVARATLNPPKSKKGKKKK